MTCTLTTSPILLAAEAPGDAAVGAMLQLADGRAASAEAFREDLARTREKLSDAEQERAALKSQMAERDAAVARERETGTLRVLRSHGMTARSLMTGKMMALGGVAALMLLPAALSLVWLVAAEGASSMIAGLMALGYALYLGLWVIGIVTVSALVRDARTALMALLGIWALTSILVPRIAPDVASSIERDVFPVVASERRLFGVATDDYWIDTGRPELYVRANLDLLDGVRHATCDPIGADAVVDPSAVVEHSVVGDGAIVGPGATVVDSVLLPGAQVGAHAVVRRSAVRGRVAAGAVVTDMLVADPPS